MIWELNALGSIVPLRLVRRGELSSRCRLRAVGTGCGNVGLVAVRGGDGRWTGDGEGYDGAGRSVRAFWAEMLRPIGKVRALSELQGSSAAVERVGVQRERRTELWDPATVEKCQVKGCAREGKPLSVGLSEVTRQGRTHLVSLIYTYCLSDSSSLVCSSSKARVGAVNEGTFGRCGRGAA